MGSRITVADWAHPRNFFNALSFSFEIPTGFAAVLCEGGKMRSKPDV
jgi:hypothetical protein